MNTLSNVTKFVGNGKEVFYLKINGTVYSFPLPSIEYECLGFNDEGKLSVSITSSSKNELKKIKGLNPNFPYVYSTLANEIAFYPYVNGNLNNLLKISYAESTFVDPRINFEIPASEVQNALPDVTTSSGKIIREIYIHFKDGKGYRGGDYRSPTYTIMLYNLHKKYDREYSVLVNDAGRMFGTCYGSLPNPRYGEQYPDMQTITLNGERIYLADDGIFHIGPYEFHGMQNGDFKVNSDFCYTTVEVE